MTTRNAIADGRPLVQLIEELLETCEAPDLRMPPVDPLLRRLTCRSRMGKQSRR